MKYSSIFLGSLLISAVSNLGYAAGEGTAIGSDSKISALSSVRNKMMECSQKYQFYTENGCQPYDLSSLPVNVPIPAGLQAHLGDFAEVVQQIGFSMFTPGGGGGTKICKSASYTCFYSCPRSSWVTVVGGHIQPYYCQVPPNTTNSFSLFSGGSVGGGATTYGDRKVIAASCADMESVRNGTGDAILASWVNTCLDSGNVPTAPLTTTNKVFINNMAITPTGAQEISETAYVVPVYTGPDYGQAGGGGNGDSGN